MFSAVGAFIKRNRIVTENDLTSLIKNLGEFLKRLLILEYFNTADTVNSKSNVECPKNL